MLNFIKKNKYKIIILPIVLLLGIFVSGCTNNNANAKDKTFSEGRGSDEPYVLVDKDTKQQYIVVHNDVNGAVAITPRLDSNGQTMVTQ